MGLVFLTKTDIRWKVWMDAEDTEGCSEQGEHFQKAEKHQNVQIPLSHPEAASATDLSSQRFCSAPLQG